VDFRDVFDVSDLTDDELGHIEWVLNSPSYETVFKRYLMTMSNTLNQRLKDPSRERKDQYPSDFLRGGILMIDGLVTFFSKIVAETQMERIARSKGVGLSQEELYEKLRQEGKSRPAGQTAQAEDAYDPTQDF
jgi:hypothetical protein